MGNQIFDDAQTALKTSPIYALRNLTVEQSDEMLLICGKVDSYYHKQMAQEVVRLVSRDIHVVNQIDVIEADG